ncbi:protease pro-enzyme activation domain-containing protein [Actinoplanes sp. NPDC049265]|uniref:S53 family peptidase n=1 Tax=Actinoplanes sp. NPDC049265 TaxID=3363902 RepID=UPI003715EF44
MLVAGVLLLGPVAGIAAATVTPGSARAGGRTVLPSARPIYLTAGDTGTAADPGQVLAVRVYLAGRNSGDRRSAAHAVSTPGGAAYAHYLSPAQFAERFGSTPAQARRVSDWLTAQGITVTATDAHYVAASASVAQLDAAFATDLRAYDGILAPAGDISVPEAMGADVATVTGLNAWATAARRKPSRRHSPTPATARARRAADYPCSHWWGEHSVNIPPAYGHSSAPTVPCGYSVKQMRAAYGVTGSPYTGKGATIALILDNGSPTMEADANRFFADQGVPGFRPGQYREDFSPTFASTCDRFAHPEPGSFPDVGRLEQAIDVESAHIFAPDATVVYVGADCGGDTQQNLLDAHFRVVDKHLADVASESFSISQNAFTPADIAAWDLMFLQGTIEGIGFTFDSGDDGDIGAGAPTEVTFPASDPWATGVGGTSLRLGPDGRVLGESGWGDNDVLIGPDGYRDRSGEAATPPGWFTSGSGGGVSAVIDQPGYQREVVPAALATAGGAHPARRTVPDLAADAGLAWQIGFTGAKDPAGGYDVVAWGAGTSAASPLVAALSADAKQATGHALGFLNPALYRLAGTTAVHDVLPVDPADPPIMAGATNGTGAAEDPYLVTLGLDSSLVVTPGYDDVTGIGSPAASFVGTFRHLPPRR